MKVKRASRLEGSISLPGDKSISHRAAMFAAIADGRTTITNFLAAEDCLSTLECLRQLGVQIRRDGTAVEIVGGGLRGLQSPIEPLDCGNSGTTARLICGILAGQSFDTTITGDESLQKRPMLRIIQPLEALGALLDNSDGFLPVTVRGGHPLVGVEQHLSVASAQVKSCILLAGLYADGTTTVIEPIPTRDHTERMLGWLGVDVTVEPFETGNRISLAGGQNPVARDISVPADISSAAFFLVAAACLPDSHLRMPNVGLNPTRRGIVEVLRGLGVSIMIENERDTCNEPVGELTVTGGIDVNGKRDVIDGSIIPNIIDEIPILAVLGTQLPGGLELRGAAELRVKETDRIAAIVANLRAMSADVSEFEDGFRVERSELRGAEVDSFGDHRIAMAFAVAGLLANGETEIRDAECAGVSFPAFFETLQSVSLPLG